MDDASLAMGSLTILLGLFLVFSPERSARMWGRENLDAISAQRRKWYLRGFRTLRSLLCVAGVLVTVQSQRIWT
jgi:hypothetical protein